jgi:hypothetical protein
MCSPVRIVREDPGNRDVLYCGNERGTYVTFDRGEHWLVLGGKSLPTVPVYDLALQARRQDLVAGTHGRSIWIMDGIGSLSELPAAKDQALKLFSVADATPALFGFRGYGSGNRVFKGPNPAAGAVVTFWLRDLPEEAVSVKVADENGAVVRTLASPGRPGLNRVVWDLQADPKHRFNDPRKGGPVFVEPGSYTVTVTAGENSDKTEFEVLPYPGWVAVEEKAQLPPASPTATSAPE